ncbi:MAG: hypothetical protein HQK79_18870 [Desulfobacterales bacterium]|nr:hypothetical protein [Desulfobacterales bacterium]
MKFMHQNLQCLNPEVSLILLDWSCRESFHVLDYLMKQTVPRKDFEVIWIEYYNSYPDEINLKINQSIKEGIESPIDQWIVLEMPKNLYYHKHLLYNVGIVYSHGRIICIADSDAIVSPTFVEEIIKAFKEDSNIVLHMDEIRNTIPKRFYPFNYPQISEILGEGCINYKNGKTTGLIDNLDPIHTRNYGACMCALKKDLIAIGGADEHLDFLGHVCGPYDMTFRLVNAGKKEKWHQSEFLYHVWHPGTDGIQNFIGPHDGKHMSSVALKSQKTGRILPLLENEAIRLMRTDNNTPFEMIEKSVISPDCIKKWSIERINSSAKFYKMEDYTTWQKKNRRRITEKIKKFFKLSSPLIFLDQPSLFGSFLRHNIVLFDNKIYCVPKRLGNIDLRKKDIRSNKFIFTAKSIIDAKLKILFKYII